MRQSFVSAGLARLAPLALLALLAALAALAALAGAPRARAGDEAAEAAARLADKWTDGADTLTPEQLDAQRASLLEPVAASASPAALETLFTVARERTESLFRARERLKKIEEREKAKADEAAGGKEPKKPLDGGEARARVEEEMNVVRDKERLPLLVAREERWHPRLAEAAGKVLEALSDPDFQKVAAPRIRESLGDPLEGWADWVGSTMAKSRRERTERLLLDAGGDAIAELRKALAARVGPAKELDKVNQDINKLIFPYLERQQKAGDFSAQVPSSLVPDSLRREQNRLEGEIARLNGAVESADHRRGAARNALGGMLAGAPEDAREKLLDVLEKECLAAKDFEARCFGIGAAGPCPGDRAMKFLREAAKDPNADIVVAALDALAARSEAEAVEILGAAVVDVRWQVRASAALGLAGIGRASAVPPLLKALASAEGRSVDDVHAALVKLTGRKLPPVAAAWEEWWAKAGKEFKGPKDPGYGEASAGDGKDGGSGPRDDSRISFYGIETKSQRLLFILDFSGSMNFAGSSVDSTRKKIDVLHEEMKKTLASLPDGAKFNMVGFSSDVRVWRKGPATRDAKVAKEAMDWVEKQKVIGSTNIYDALETGFKMMGVGVSADKAYEPVFDTIFFMTDGRPTSGKTTDTKLILGEVRRWNEAKKLRIHVVGMGGKAKGGGGGPAAGPGDDIDRDFLKKLAAENAGECVLR